MRRLEICLQVGTDLYVAIAQFEDIAGDHGIFDSPDDFTVFNQVSDCDIAGKIAIAQVTLSKA